MSRYNIIIRSIEDRLRAAKILDAAPFGARVEIKATKRTGAQNDLMWSLLTQVAQQLPWDGHKLRPDDWKIIFLNALRREERLVPNIEGDGFVNLRQSSSDLTKAEMSDLIEIIREFSARHGVKFSMDEVAA